MTTDTTQQAETAPSRRLSGNLGTISIIFMVIAAAAPLTVVGGLMPIAFLMGNGIGLPVMFLVATVILILFAVGLLAMGKQIPGSGAFFAYITHGLGRTAGTAGAYLALLTYSAVQVSVFALLGGAVSSSLALIGLPVIPWWVFALVGIAIVGFLGYRHIELSSKVLFVALGLEILVGLLLALVVLATGGAEGVTFGSFKLSEILSGAPGVALMFAFAGFIGFESSVVYRNEVRNADRTIPRATYGAAVIIGLFYALTAWALVLAAGESNLLAVAGEDPAGMLARITDEYLGPVGSIVATVLLIGSMFAAALSLHNVLTRYFHTMSHRGLLPELLGDVHTRHGSPHKAAIVQVSIATVLTVVIVIAGLPAEIVLTWLAGIGTLALVLLLATTCLATIVYFARNRGLVSAWRGLIAPALGLIGLIAAALLIIMNFPIMVADLDAEGIPVWGVASFGTLLVVVLTPFVGVIQARVIRKRDPEAYSRITEGFDAE